jgi:hypothetical protein
MLLDAGINFYWDTLSLCHSPHEPYIAQIIPYKVASDFNKTRDAVLISLANWAEFNHQIKHQEAKPYLKPADN